MWLWKNEARKIFCLASLFAGFLDRRFSRVFGLLEMVIFGDDDNMVERFVEIDARVFLKAQHGNRARCVTNGLQYSEKQWFLDAKQR